eukprot:GHVT01058679.1.p1 GENE.GHVT01058679.1~~GHVT01058679.1.p1  ORF type:complete len:287 (-),score=33.82 GHVT01058679.1:636-1496(-)
MEKTVAKIPQPDLSQFCSYADYLDYFLTEDDKQYIDRALARRLVEFGGPDVLSRAAFIEQRERLEESAQPASGGEAPSLLASWRISGGSSPLLNLLAARESRLRTGQLLSILYLRAVNPRTQGEVSAFIDFAHRLKKVAHTGALSSGRLYPDHSDLSYCDWLTQRCSYQATENFDVVVFAGGGASRPISWTAFNGSDAADSPTVHANVKSAVNHAVGTSTGEEERFPDGTTDAAFPRPTPSRGGTSHSKCIEAKMRKPFRTGVWLKCRHDDGYIELHTGKDSNIKR